MLRDGFGKFLACAASGRCEGDVHALEVVVMLEQLHFHLLAAERIFTTGRTLAAEKNKFINGEMALLKDAEELLANGTAGTYDCYFHLRFFLG